ncbi:MAG TPA: ATP-binding domain-containing protein [Micromonosporaceae bacterium]|nr:ATP-binding domain-containing protein [Micromonosporaceae bacterium]
MSSDVASEQIGLSNLYRRLDEQRERAAARLRDALAEVSTNHQARSLRDATAAMYGEQIARYDAAENNLCFGRLDFTSGPPRHIGRIGLFDDADEPALLDWRTPAARPFYVATVANPEGVTRRRQIRTRMRRVTAVHDEILTAGAGSIPTGGAGGAGEDGLTSEAALLDAVAAARTGRMSDIVATIQAEQDAVIRADRAGVMVVDGGPGTGKTAVALHRAAYLLYTHRDTLASRGVLIVGPNTTFLRYIGRVLPGLGETAVVLATVGDLLPGVPVSATDGDAAAEVKGRATMADVLAAALADRQRVPDEPWEIEVDREVLYLDAYTVDLARRRTRGTELPHNEARPLFARLIVRALAEQLADRVGADPLGGENLLGAGDVEAVAEDLAASAPVRAAIDALWPRLTPQTFLEDLYADPDAVEAATPYFTRAERATLHRARGHGWTTADIALLDEAAELLGTDERAARREAADELRRDRAYAQGVLDIMSRDIDDDIEVLMAHDLIDASRLAERQAAGDGLTVAERAAADRSWAYGHVIVDEAQELSAMAWRALMRRCPGRSMTLVGDIAQTGDPGGASSWGEVLDPYVAGRWRREPLTVNYRTPAEIMDVAAGVLRSVDPGAPVPRSIRRAGEAPWRLRVDADRLVSELATVVEAEVAALGEGRLGVVVPAEWLADVRAALPDAATGDDADLTSPVVVLTVRQAKGLEFDTVLVVEPAAMLAASPRGAGDLYVALTRATRRLGVLHTGDVPPALESLRERATARLERATVG